VAEKQPRPSKFERDNGGISGEEDAFIASATSLVQEREINIFNEQRKTS